MTTDTERLRPLVTPDVLWGYLTGVERYLTSDLVVFLAVRTNQPMAFTRTAWLEHAVGVPEPVRAKLALSAAQASERPLEGNQTAFWFVAEFLDGDMAAMVIVSQRMQEAGDA
jgi:hypothetical protein